MDTKDTRPVRHTYLAYADSAKTICLGSCYAKNTAEARQLFAEKGVYPKAFSVWRYIKYRGTRPQNWVLLKKVEG